LGRFRLFDVRVLFAPGESLYADKIQLTVGGGHARFSNSKRARWSLAAERAAGKSLMYVAAEFRMARSIDLTHSTGAYFAEV